MLRLRSRACSCIQNSTITRTLKESPALARRGGFHLRLRRIERGDNPNCQIFWLLFGIIDIEPSFFPILDDL
jgi:hypothetical protein